MAPLSDLSIGFIVGGSVLFVSLILGFVVWKIIDSKRRAKPKDVNAHTGQLRVETGAANDMGGHRNGRGSKKPESVYADVHLEGDDHIITANKSTDSGTGESNRITTNDSTDDSGYYESQGFIGRSEVYARLHEVQNHVENVYSDFTDRDSGQGSHVGANSVSGNSDDERGSSSYSVVMPIRKTSSNQRDKNGAEATPRSNILESDNEMYYSATLPRVDIIEVRRPTVYEVADEFNKNLVSERDEASNSSRESDAPSVQETPL